MGSSQQFSLRWNNYLKHITCAFDTLRTDEDLVDVTLSCEGKKIRAHKMLLSACSTYFRELFKENPCQHPVIIFRNVKFDDLAALVDFMYQGEVNVVQEQLASFLTTAELLAVQGLTDGTGKDSDSLGEDDTDIPNEPEVQLQNASVKSNDKNNKSPLSPMPYHAVDLPEGPPIKKRKCRENININTEKAANSNTHSTKDNENKSENQTLSSSDPVEIIPLMPNLKLEMPEYVEHDGSSCSYEEQSIGDSSMTKMMDDIQSDTTDHDRKPDLGQSFYGSNQSVSDSLDLKHQSSDIGHLHSKPGTSGERLAQDAVQVNPKTRVGTQQNSRRRIKKNSRGRLKRGNRWTTSATATTATLTTSRRGTATGSTSASTNHGNTTTSSSTTGSSRSSPNVSCSANLYSDPDPQTVVVEQPSHSCKLCGKSFWNRDSMYKHMNMHKGTTQCPVCHKVLSRTTHMKRHLKNRHGWLGGSVTTTTTSSSVPTSPSTSLASPSSSEVRNAISVSSTATIAQQQGLESSPTFTTIRIRESSVERITSSPIP